MLHRLHSRSTAVGLCLLALWAYAGIGTLRAQTNVLDELKTQFNKDKGVPRLIVLMSPT